MKFKNRLLYYLIGFTLGLTIVFSVIGIRGCEWLPENRILQAISKTQIYVLEEDLNKINCNNSTDIIFDLLSNGKVIFKKSKTKNDLKEYYIENKKISLSILINFKDSISKIKHINGLKKCNFKSKTNKYVPLYQSNGRTLDLLKKQPLKSDKKFLISLEKLRLDSTLFQEILNDGKVLISKSKPKKRPNPLFVILLKKQDANYLILVQQGEKRTRFKKIISIDKEIEDLEDSFFNDFLILNHKWTN